MKTNAKSINLYTQPPLPWRTRKDGELYKVIGEVISMGGPMASTFDSIPNQIDRKSVVKCFGDDLYRGFVATLLWGGMHKNPNQIRHFKKLAIKDKKEIEEKLRRVKGLLEQDKPGKAFVSMLRSQLTGLANVNHIEGIGVSYITKLLYFLSNGMGLTVRPLIYDKHLATAHCALLNNQDNHFPDPVYNKDYRVMCYPVVTWAYTAEIYLHYCKLMAAIAKECGIGEVDKLEAWLFDGTASGKSEEQCPRDVCKTLAKEYENNYYCNL